MFLQKKRRVRALLRVACCGAVLCLLWVVPRVVDSGAGQEGARTLELALRRAAVQNYALEGRYPASLDELLEKSGIAPDAALYAVFYTPVGSNLMPDVTVLRRQP
ncbi:MAG: hypothetical protein EOM69_00915 [Clostridia bacterium]|nr:hypothetical protein [Clostridia bacterium]